jgi:ABC-type nickel/cobalt efflux system permease component RcnA
MRRPVLMDNRQPGLRFGLVLGLVVALVLAGLWLTGEFAVLQHWLLDQQRAVQNRLAGSVRALRGGQPGALAGLLAVCFGYGVLHAAGPGHGKLVIGSYGVAQRVRMAPLAGIALLASLAQAAVAVALVGVGVLALGWTRERLLGVSEDVLAPVGTAAIAAVGLWLMLRGLRAMRVRATRGGHDHHDHDHAPGEACNHAHGPSLSDMDHLTNWRDAVVLIGGIALRPCTGALFLLILCFGLGIGAAGIAGTFAMGLGTACVTIVVAALAVWAREGAFAGLPVLGLGGRLAAVLPLVQAVAGALLAAVALILLVEAL